MSKLVLRLDCCREHTITALVTTQLSKLTDIWEKMGLDRDALAVRNETVVKVVEKELQAMIDEEEKWMARIIKDIESHMKERARLAKELEVTVQDPDEVGSDCSIFPKNSFILPISPRRFCGDQINFPLISCQLI